MTHLETRAFVTGGTGLIGRFTVIGLLRRGVHVTMMVREGSRSARAERLESLRAEASANGALLDVVDGDLAEDGLRLDAPGRGALGAAHHVFHLAALYDITASADSLMLANVEGTRRLLATLASTGFEGVLHHVSSIAVAGDYQGTFTESMFDEGQGFPHPYHESKHRSERLVRESGVKHRIYRPSAVVGHSETGEMDRVDGPYLGFASMQQLAAAVPRFVSVPMPQVRGRMNLVPVDYVAEALVHIGLAAAAATADDAEQNGRVFHLVDPSPPRFWRMVGLFLRAMKGPKVGVQVDFKSIPGVDNALGLLNMLPSLKTVRREVMQISGCRLTASTR